VFEVVSLALADSSALTSMRGPVVILEHCSSNYAGGRDCKSWVRGGCVEQRHTALQHDVYRPRRSRRLSAKIGEYQREAAGSRARTEPVGFTKPNCWPAISERRLETTFEMAKVGCGPARPSHRHRLNPYRHQANPAGRSRIWADSENLTMVWLDFGTTRATGRQNLRARSRRSIMYRTGSRR